MPKFDELVFVVDLRHPDIICIVESWLSPEIFDHEITIPGYEHRRYDRNRHGGGVIIFVLQNQIFYHPLLEILTVTINYRKFKCSLFYRPPNTHLDFIDMLQDYLVFHAFLCLFLLVILILMF